ncbi:heme ABC transporter ATP-binding protein [Pedobacter sp. MW01-1-1]|uniref:heme ABC transporter ATP-binding protein n=1 Tax=Pedobacter sp. MW01-1-1 TaxID=3383027 RepID=UPI003FEF5C27
MLRIESISLEIGKRTLLKDISFSTKPGEIIAILGSNGAGKSTLMSVLSGEKKAGQGRVLIEGKEISSFSKKELGAKRAMLQQQNPLSIGFTVSEVVMMGRYSRYKGNPKEIDLRAQTEAMAICGITDLADRSMLTLSGGEQQRVHLARALAQIWDSPNALLLLDEPLNNMDLQYQHLTLAIAKAFAKRSFTVIMVLHDINLAAQYANRIIMLKDGRKWWDGSPAEVLTPQHMFTAFSIHALAHTDLRSLKTVVVPKEIVMDLEDFNSCTTQTKELNPLEAERKNISFENAERVETVYKKAAEL